MTQQPSASHLLLRISILLITLRTLVTASPREYRILGLLPLSGLEAPRGRAQQAGIRVAWEEEVAMLNVGPDVRTTLRIEDSQCSLGVEQNLIFNELRDPGSTASQLLILGGLCSPNGQQPGESSVYAPGIGGYADVAPQVTHEDLPALWPAPSLSTHAHLGHTSAAIRHFLSARGWHEAVIIHSPDAWYMDAAESLQKMLIQSRVQVVISSMGGAGGGGDDVMDLLKNTPIRPIIVFSSTTEAIDLMCEARLLGTEQRGRYVWLLPVPDARAVHATLQAQCGPAHEDIVQFQLKPGKTELPSYFKTKLEQLHSMDSQSDPDSMDPAPLDPEIDSWLLSDAALAYDTAKVLLSALSYLISLNIEDERNFTSLFYDRVLSSTTNGYTGEIAFTKDGNRRVTTEVYHISGEKLISMGAYGGNSTLNVSDNEDLGPGHVDEERRLEGIPVSVLVVMCSLALLGIIYAVTIMAFNIAKQRDKMIKMTSPNINVVILLGCILGYGVMVSTGIDSQYVSLDTMAKIMQGSIFTMVVCFSLIYGSVFCKCWRVYLIFKNLNFNGKLTRDEHLLIGVVVMVMLDLAILLPWTLTDPITCQRKLITTVYEESTSTDVSIEIDTCTSELFAVWLGAIYLYKFLLLLTGLYFTWQTRNVTLPSLQDDKQIYIVVYSVISLGIVALPVVIYDSAGMTVKYASGSLILFIIITVTITLLFIPKVLLFRRAHASSSDAAGSDSFRFLFSESMKKTQDALRKCSLCFCCGPAEEDKYAQEMLATEIDTLKRTIKEKDATIRELTDRLYFGAEKFQDYLKSPKHQQHVLYAMHRKHMRRTRSHPSPTGDNYAMEVTETTEPRRRGGVREFENGGEREVEGGYGSEGQEFDDGVVGNDVMEGRGYDNPSQYEERQYQSQETTSRYQPNVHRHDHTEPDRNGGGYGRDSRPSSPVSRQSSFQSRQSHVSSRPDHVTQVHHSNVAYEDSFDDEQSLQHGVTVVTVTENGLAGRGKLPYESSSPNNDSAIDNNSPSSDSSDRASDQDGAHVMIKTPTTSGDMAVVTNERDVRYHTPIHRSPPSPSLASSPDYHHRTSQQQQRYTDSANVHTNNSQQLQSHVPPPHRSPMQYTTSLHPHSHLPPLPQSPTHYNHSQQQQQQQFTRPQPAAVASSSAASSSSTHHPHLISTTIPPRNHHQHNHHHHHNPVILDPSTVESYHENDHPTKTNPLERTNNSSRGRFHSIRLNQERIQEDGAGVEASGRKKQARSHTLHLDAPSNREADAYSSPIDLEAMEYDANMKHWPTTPDSKKLSDTEHWPTSGAATSGADSRKLSDAAEVSRVELEPYRTQKINGISVSQI